MWEASTVSKWATILIRTSICYRFEVLMENGKIDDLQRLRDFFRRFFFPFLFCFVFGPHGTTVFQCVVSVSCRVSIIWWICLTKRFRLHAIRHTTIQRLPIYNAMFCIFRWSSSIGYQPKAIEFVFRMELHTHTHKLWMRSWRNGECEKRSKSEIGKNDENICDDRMTEMLLRTQLTNNNQNKGIRIELALCWYRVRVKVHATLDPNVNSNVRCQTLSLYEAAINIDIDCETPKHQKCSPITHTPNQLLPDEVPNFGRLNRACQIACYSVIYFRKIQLEVAFAGLHVFYFECDIR